jgi:hypothetical protein
MALSGCAALLPSSHSQVASNWSSFGDARSAIERIEPGRSTARDLREIGIDPYASTNVQLMSYSDVLLRFPNAGGFDQLDEGLRQCLRAGKACVGYSISAGDRVQDRRTGNFWLDVLGFKRVVEVTGWNFNAIVLLVDERVVYTLYGGQPNMRGKETASQPLGPVQNVGEALSIGSVVK